MNAFGYNFEYNPDQKDQAVKNHAQRRANDAQKKQDAEEQAPEAEANNNQGQEQAEGQKGQKHFEYKVTKETDSGQAEKLEQAKERLSEIISKVKTSRIEVVEKILLILYHITIKIPGTASIILNDSESISVLFKLATDNYPFNLQVIAINVISELSQRINFTGYEGYQGYLENIRDKLVNTFKAQSTLTGPNSKLLEAYRNNLIKLARGLIVSTGRPQAEDLTKLLLDKNDQLTQAQHINLVLSILYQKCSKLTASNAVPGQLVSLKSDLRNLKYILLPKDNSLYFKKYTDLLFTTYGKRAANESSNSDMQIHSKRSRNAQNLNDTLLQRFMFLKCRPVLCLKSGDIRIVKEEEINVETLNDAKWRELSVDILKRYNLITTIMVCLDQKAGEHSYKDLKNLLKLLMVIHDYELKAFYEQAQTIVAKILQGHKVANAVVTSEFADQLLADHTKLKVSKFKKSSNRENKFAKFIGRRNKHISANLRNERRNERVSGFNRNNFYLSRSTVCKDIIDTEVFLGFNDLSLDRDKDQYFHNEIIKKRIKVLSDKIEASSKSPGLDTILGLWFDIQNRAESFKQSNLRTKFDEILLKYETEEKKTELIDQILAKFEAPTPAEFRKAFYGYEVAFVILRAVKNPEYFEVIAKKILTALASLIKQFSQSGGEKGNLRYEDHPYSIDLILLLSKKTKELITALNGSKQVLDLTKQTEELKTIFSVTEIHDVFTLNFTIKLNNEELATVYKHLTIALCLYTKFDEEETLKVSSLKSNFFDYPSLHFQTLIFT